MLGSAVATKLLAKTKRDARQAAIRLLKAQGIVHSPVPVDRVAKDFGIAVRYAPLEDNLSGMAFVRDGQGAIVVNALHHPNRQRFTIAHELGHHVLHADILAGGDVHVDKVILHRGDLSASGTNYEEISANAFASELLLPGFLLDQEGASLNDMLDETRLLETARRFKVSLTALQFRLAAQD